jgi:hypothetical protein
MESQCSIVGQGEMSVVFRFKRTVLSSQQVRRVGLGAKPVERGAPEMAARHSEAVVRYSQLSVIFRSVRLQIPMLASSFAVLSGQRSGCLLALL